MRKVASGCDFLGVAMPGCGLQDRLVQSYTLSQVDGSHPLTRLHERPKYQKNNAWA